MTWRTIPSHAWRFFVKAWRRYWKEVFAPHDEEDEAAARMW